MNTADYRIVPVNNVNPIMIWHVECNEKFVVGPETFTVSALLRSLTLHDVGCVKASRRLHEVTSARA